MLSRRQILGVGGLLTLSPLLGYDGEYRQTYNPHIIRFKEEDQRGQSFLLHESAFRGTEHFHTVPLPHEMVHRLESELQLVNSVLTPDNQVHSLTLTKINPDPMHNGRKMYTNSYPNFGEPDIPFALYPDIQYFYADLGRTIFHESMHRLNNQGDHAALMTPQVGRFYDWLYKQRRTNEMADTYDDDPYSRQINLAKTGLFPLFDESSYIVNTAPSIGRIGRDLGHPYDKTDELLASTLNVLRHFPRGFMASVDTLPPESSQPVKHFAKFALRQSQQAASDPDKFAKLFFPQLLQYLHA